MKFFKANSTGPILRAAFSVAALAAIAFLLAGCGPQVAGPHSFDRAKQLEQRGRYTEALQMYDALVHDYSQKSPELAAQSLYEAGAFADSPNYGKTPDQRNQPQSANMRNDGQNQAWQRWKQLRDDYPALAQKPTLLGPNYEKLQALGEEIGKRNSSDWKYQLMDALVALTGRRGAFSYAFALIFLGVGVKLLLLPISMKQYKSQREMQQLMPKIKELSEKYKGAERNQKQMELYKEHGVNPFAGCMPMLFTMPFFILIYWAVRSYEPAFYHGTFLWIGSSLSRQYPNIFANNLALPDIPLLVMYTLTNYVVMRMNPAPDPQQQQQQSSMALMTSVIFFYMFLNYKWSSAFVLYWLALNIFSIWQTYTYVYKPHKERMRTAGPAATLGAGDVNNNGAGSTPAIEPNKAESANGRSQTGKQPGAASQPGRVRPRKKGKR